MIAVIFFGLVIAAAILAWIGDAMIDHHNEKSAIHPEPRE